MQISARDGLYFVELASIMGNFTSAIPAIPFAQSHFRSMQRFYISRARRADYDLKNKCVLSEGAWLDFQFKRISSLKVDRDKLFFPDVPDLEIYTDASLSGCGACCIGVKIRGSWTIAYTKIHYELELMGALISVQAFAAKSSSISIRIYLDNASASAYINHCGGTRSNELTSVSAELTNWCEII
jgi:hypothetical protein